MLRLVRILILHIVFLWSFLNLKIDVETMQKSEIFGKGNEVGVCDAQLDTSRYIYGICMNSAL